MPREEDNTKQTTDKLSNRLNVNPNPQTRHIYTKNDWLTKILLTDSYTAYPVQGRGELETIPGHIGR